MSDLWESAQLQTCSKSSRVYHRQIIIPQRCQVPLSVIDELVPEEGLSLHIKTKLYVSWFPDTNQIPEFSKWAQGSHRHSVHGRGKDHREPERWQLKMNPTRRDGFEGRGGDHRQGMQAPLKERKGNRFPPEPPRGTQPCQHLCFSPLTSRTIGK